MKVKIGKNPTGIHGALNEIRGEFTVDRSTVSPWASRFRGACVRIDNDPRQGSREHELMKEV